MYFLHLYVGIILQEYGMLTPSRHCVCGLELTPTFFGRPYAIHRFRHARPIPPPPHPGGPRARPPPPPGTTPLEGCARQGILKSILSPMGEYFFIIPPNTTPEQKNTPTWGSIIDIPPQWGVFAALDYDPGSTGPKQ